MIRDLDLLIWSAIVLMVILIIFVHREKNKKRALRLKVGAHFSALIEQVACLEAYPGTTVADMQIQDMEIVQQLLRKKGYRNWLIQDIITTKSSLTGSTAQHFIALYEYLQLDKDSFAKTKSTKWYIKAKGIQELYLMENRKYIEALSEYTIHKDEAVRAEAQLGMVCLKGFDGLQFLDTLKTPISDWDQIRLLNHLKGATYSQFARVDHWLQSKNDSVVLFALKIIRIYHLFQFHQRVITCLAHENIQITLLALETLQHIYDESTEQHIIHVYTDFKNTALKSQALKTLAVVGSEASLPLLERELIYGNNSIRLLSARAIVRVSKEGISLLEKIVSSNEHLPMIVFEQVKSEMI